MVTSQAVSGALWLAMIAAAAWGTVRLAPGARIPVHFGSAERCFWVGKRAGLIIWPAAGALCCATLGGVSASSLAAGWVPGVRDVLLPAVMCVLLGFQIGALALARRGTAPAPAAGRGRGAQTTARSDQRT
jgi:hypothetical protein